MELILRYGRPAPDSPEGWEKNSLPIGCSHFGGNVFGGIGNERIQITENSLENPCRHGGLNSFADIRIRFQHDENTVTGYERGLDIGRALAYVRYDACGTHVEREYFASYPDRALVGKVTSSSPLSYAVSLEIPYLTEEEGREKRGEVLSDGNTLSMKGVMCAYNVRFSGFVRVFSDGIITSGNGEISVENATETVFAFCCGTNYELRPEVFLEDDEKKKLRDFDPSEGVLRLLDAACAKTYGELKDRHLKDHSSLFGRVSLELGEMEVPDKMTDELLKEYSEGKDSRYLEVLYFQFGRYLLMASSRPGALPANLQGVWNCHDRSPWGSGYWHNINVQMNYWPAFVTNLAETFEAYRAFYEAFRPAAEKFASEYVKETVPENYVEGPGECGWTIGTGNYAYTISGPGGHSGPGTGGLTSKLFWDAYAFSGSTEVLKNVAYPALLAMAKHLLKVVRKYDGLYLSAFSASPEQIIANNWSNPVQYYHTVGCAFDQQMILENEKDLLKCVELIGMDNLPEEDLPVICELMEQIDLYDPVQVGWSGQIKEYREEKFYGEVGEFRHRHISQLVGLYPGTVINSSTPAWLDAAKVTLDYRSDRSTGWALAHRLNAWARTGDGNRAYRLYRNLLGTRTLPNLWDTHPPFQIDGNLGGTSGVAEMLIQSHEEYIAPLPCIPECWDKGSYSGLVARGGFEIGVRWENGSAYEMRVKSLAGNTCRIKYDDIASADIPFPHECPDDNKIEFPTEAGSEYVISGIPQKIRYTYPRNLRAEGNLVLKWDYSGPVKVWRALGSSPDYALLASSVRQSPLIGHDMTLDENETVTYKVTRDDATDGSAPGSVVTVNHSTPAERRRYRYLVRQLNAVCDDLDPDELLKELPEE